jgi:hypothetical protein
MVDKEDAMEVFVDKMQDSRDGISGAEILLFRCGTTVYCAENGVK